MEKCRNLQEVKHGHGAATLLILLQISTLIGAVELNTIISDSGVSIQIIPLDSLSTWPPVSSGPPVEVSFRDNRIWLIWPQEMVSLNSRGEADERTLPVLFYSSPEFNGETPVPDEKQSAPGVNSTVASGGIRLSVSGAGGTLEGLDLYTGRRVMLSWDYSEPRFMTGTDTGALIVTSEELLKVTIPPGPDMELEVEALITPFPEFFVHPVISETEGWAAWGEMSRTRIRTWGDTLFETAGTPSTAGEASAGIGSEQTIPAEGLPQGLARFGSALIQAYPGEIRLLDTGITGLITGKSNTSFRTAGDTVRPSLAENTVVLTDDSLRHWYTLHGGDDSLGILIPQQNRLMILRSAALTPAAQQARIERETTDGTLPNREDADELIPPLPEWAEFLEQFIPASAAFIDAGSSVEDRSRFYSWLIREIRIQRSRDPLNPLWADWEEAGTNLRVRLREEIR